MSDCWDLTPIYAGFYDIKLQNDKKHVEETVKELDLLASEASSLSHEQLILKYLDLNEQLAQVSTSLAEYASLVYSADTGCTAAQSLLGNLQSMLSKTAASDASLRRRISGFEDLDKLIETNPSISEFGYYLRKLREDSRYLLSDSEEALLARMDISGASAWSDLQSSLTSTVQAEYRGEKLPLSSVRNLAYDPDPQVRKDAYDAELACYPLIGTSVAFALSSIKLQVLNECEIRGYASPLDKALADSRMDRETLSALWSAVDDYLPVFRKYLRVKAAKLGHAGALPWWDLFAPMGKSEKKYSAEEAYDYLTTLFGSVDKDICSTIQRAFDEHWIDFYPRAGKVGGAFDSSVPSIGQSRILTNFAGSFSDIGTLAHELGHAFHDQQVFSHKQLNQEYSMPVAETASTFNEILVVSQAIAETDDVGEKLALIEGQLSDATQIITDCYSRFLFESSVFEARRDEFLDSERLCDLMREAQKKTYGDGIDESTLHPYMWLCKSHYYSGDLSFYNFPYTFGGLFARGLYSMYLEQGGDVFFPKYKEMLRFTSVSDVEECAATMGIDLHRKSFWSAGLQSFADEIELFCRLLGES